MKIKSLVGSGDKIAGSTLVGALVILWLNRQFPSVFAIEAVSIGLTYLTWIVLIFGLVLWLWSVYLVLTKVPKHELITTGPFALVKHPLYSSVALLVLPSLGVLLHTWLGLGIGLVLYLATRIFAPEEEKDLARTFGDSWAKYSQSVKFPWL